MMPHLKLLSLFLSIHCCSVIGQGLIAFETRNGVGVDARVSLPNGQPVGPGFTAQLFGGPRDTPKEILPALFPTTTFRTDGGVTGYYVVVVPIVVPGVPAGEIGSFYMRVYNGPNWEQATIRGESPLFLGITGVNGGNFIGLRDFSVAPVIAEPRTFGLFVVGLILLKTWRHTPMK